MKIQVRIYAEWRHLVQIRMSDDDSDFPATLSMCRKAFDQIAGRKATRGWWDYEVQIRPIPRQAKKEGR